MSRLLSNSQIDQLGDRLRVDPISEEDYKLLQQLRSEYDEPMGLVEQIIREELAFKATSRLKTTNTIIDKLRRQSTRLSQMQDIAGLRIVSQMSLDQQNAVVAALTDRFPGAHVIDRRRRPSSGYRAVHVVPSIDGLLVEIQVRTTNQDAWAQGFEKLSDQIGRGIRYGMPPDAPEGVWGPNTTHRDAVELWMKLSRNGATWEEVADSLGHVQEQLARLHPEKPVPEELAAQLEGLLREREEVLAEQGRILESMFGRP